MMCYYLNVRFQGQRVKLGRHTDHEFIVFFLVLPPVQSFSATPPPPISLLPSLSCFLQPVLQKLLTSTDLNWVQTPVCEQQ